MKKIEIWYDELTGLIYGKEPLTDKIVDIKVDVPSIGNYGFCVVSELKPDSN